jgi:trehalose 6-phosphate synthase
MPTNNLDKRKRHLLVVSNRLPISIKREPDGSFSSRPAGGGLVTALSGLAETTNFLWFGWPGIEVKDASEKDEVRRSLDAHNAIPIFLDEKLADDHYNGFSSKLIHLHV